MLGSSNTKVSGDWVQSANPLLKERFGGEAATVVGTLGRTQPADRGCDSAPLPPEGERRDLCSIRSYAERVVERAEDAAVAARPVGPVPVVAARSYLIQDPSSNALILGLNAAGDAATAPVNRSLTPPWLTGNVVGTVTASARIGDVLLSSMPGEAYPQIPLKVGELTKPRGHMTAGLANDQLGYLIAPYQSYPEPIRRSFFNERGDEVSPIDNDNYFFNVSTTMGERVTCSLLRGAGEVFGRGASLAMPMGPAPRSPTTSSSRRAPTRAEAEHPSAVSSGHARRRGDGRPPPEPRGLLRAGGARAHGGGPGGRAALVRARRGDLPGGRHRQHPVRGAQSGSVSIHRDHLDGRRLTLAELRHGDMFGELALFSGETRSATAEALEDTSLVALLSGDMQRVLRANPDIALKMLAALANRVRRVNERLISQSFQTVAGRVASTLLDQVTVRQDEGAGDREVLVRATQAEIANLAGTSRESASRFLATLEREGVVALGRGKVTVHEPERLRAFIH